MWLEFVIALVLAIIILFLISWWIDKELHSEKFYDELIHRLQKDDTLWDRNRKLNTLIEGTVSSQIKKVGPSSKSMEGLDIDSKIKEAVDQAIKKYATSKEEVPQKQEEAVPEFVTEFASSYDMTRKRFYSVSKAFDNDTVFKITHKINEDTGKITIDERSFPKILERIEFVDGACTYIGSGNSIRIVKEGIASRSGGEWTVDEPMKIELYEK